MLDTDKTTNSVFFEMQPISSSSKIKGTSIRVAKTCCNILVVNIKKHLSISSHCSETEFLFDYWAVQAQDDAFMMRAAPSPVQRNTCFMGMELSNQTIMTFIVFTLQIWDTDQPDSCQPFPYLNVKLMTVHQM